MNEPDTLTESAAAEARATEFPSDQHRAGHVAALAREKKSYEDRAESASSRGDTTTAELARGRAGQVDEELKRLSGAARKPSQRAERR